MKAESLNALLIDRELGELSPEAIELLEAWLAEHPESGASAPQIRGTVATARNTMRRCPELARPERNVVPLRTRLPLIPLALAASIAVLAGGTAWLGFRAGRLTTERTSASSQQEPPRQGGLVTSSPTKRAPAQVNNPAGPWARYALASDPHGGLIVIRRDRGLVTSSPTKRAPITDY